MLTIAESTITERVESVIYFTKKHKHIGYKIAPNFNGFSYIKRADETILKIDI